MATHNSPSEYMAYNSICGILLAVPRSSASGGVRQEKRTGPRPLIDTQSECFRDQAYWMHACITGAAQHSCTITKKANSLPKNRNSLVQLLSPSGPPALRPEVPPRKSCQSLLLTHKFCPPPTPAA
eukprot:6185092-Pleurochrysis_carterae.AAC.1